MASLPELAIIGLAVRVLAALALIVSAVGQLRALDAFAGVVANYRILPASLAEVAARGLPPAMFALAVACLALPRSGALAVAALLAAFAGAMALNLRRGRRDIDCGCHQGAHKQSLRWVLVGRNLVLVGALVLAAGIPQVTDATSALLGLTAGGAGFVLYLALNGLWALGPPPPRRAISIAKVSA